MGWTAFVTYCVHSSSHLVLSSPDSHNGGGDWRGRVRGMLAAVLKRLSLSIAAGLGSVRVRRPFRHGGETARITRFLDRMQPSHGAAHLVCQMPHACNAASASTARRTRPVETDVYLLMDTANQLGRRDRAGSMPRWPDLCHAALHGLVAILRRLLLKPRRRQSEELPSELRRGQTRRSAPLS